MRFSCHTTQAVWIWNWLYPMRMDLFFWFTISGWANTQISHILFLGSLLIRIFFFTHNFPPFIFFYSTFDSTFDSTICLPEKMLIIWFSRLSTSGKQIYFLQIFFLCFGKSGKSKLKSLSGKRNGKLLRIFLLLLFWFKGSRPVYITPTRKKGRLHKTLYIWLGVSI